MALPGKKVLVVAGVAAALAGGVTVGATASGASAAARPTVTYQVYKNGAVGNGPWAIRPGVAKINIIGKGDLFQLVRSRKGAGEKALVRDNTTLNKGNPVPAELDFQLMGGTTPGHSFWLHLVPGTYYAFNPNTNLTYAKIKKIIVRNAEWNAPVPAAATITAVGSRSWSSVPASIPRQGVFRFANKAKQSHFVDLIRMRPGKTKADIAKAIKGQETFPQVFYTGKGDDISSGAISPGRTMLQTYSGKAGTWGLLCFYPDRKTGMPHAFMGMWNLLEMK